MSGYVAVGSRTTHRPNMLPVVDVMAATEPLNLGACFSPRLRPLPRPIAPGNLFLTTILRFYIPPTA